MLNRYPEFSRFDASIYAIGQLRAFLLNRDTDHS
jgi:hypothetical protein